MKSGPDLFRQSTPGVDELRVVHSYNPLNLTLLHFNGLNGDRPLNRFLSTTASFRDGCADGTCATPDCAPV